MADQYSVLGAKPTKSDLEKLSSGETHVTI